MEKFWLELSKFLRVLVVLNSFTSSSKRLDSVKINMDDKKNGLVTKVWMVTSHVRNKIK